MLIASNSSIFYLKNEKKITSLISETFNAPLISCLLQKTNNVAPANFLSKKFHKKKSLHLALINYATHFYNLRALAYHCYQLPK